MENIEKPKEEAKPEPKLVAPNIIDKKFEKLSNNLSGKLSEYVYSNQNSKIRDGLVIKIMKETKTRTRSGKNVCRGRMRIFVTFRDKRIMEQARIEKIRKFGNRNLIGRDKSIGLWLPYPTTLDEAIEVITYISGLDLLSKRLRNIIDESKDIKEFKEGKVM